MNKEKILNKVKSFWAGCKKNADVDSKQTDKAIWKNTAFNVGDKIRCNIEGCRNVAFKVVDIDREKGVYILEDERGRQEMPIYCEGSYDLYTDMISDTLSRNSFIIHFADDFEVEQWHIKSYQLSDYFLTGDDKPRKQVKIGIKQTMQGESEENMSGFGDGKVVEIWKSFNEKEYTCFAIDDIDYKGRVVARQFFTLPVAINISFCKNDYSDDEIKSYEVTIQYDEIVEGSVYEKIHSSSSEELVLAKRAADLINRMENLRK